jgi:Undecaprenyl-phosphate glucose phosphotransferase
MSLFCGYSILLTGGVVVANNSYARSLFIDGHPGFGLPAETRTDRAALALPLELFVLAAIVLDFCVLLLLLGVTLRLDSFVSLSLPQNGFVAVLESTVLVLLLFNASKLHRIEMIGNFLSFIRVFQKIWLLLFVAVFAADAIVSIQSSSLAQYIGELHWLRIALCFAIGWGVFAGTRLGLSRLFRLCAASEIISHKVVVVGATELTTQFIKRVKEDALGANVTAIFDDESEISPQRMIEGVPVRGNVEDLLSYNKRHAIDTVVIALPLVNSERMHNLVQQLSLQPLRVRLLPGALTMKSSAPWCAPTREMPGVQLMSIIDLPIERFGLFAKSLADRAMAAFALLLFAPLMIVCAIAIKMTSSGPIFFRQKRIGYRNREFSVYKFRSMHVSACNTGKLTTRDDPRVFAFGQIMRKLSFDELPQLFNVLRGDMSMVGPRPHMPEARAGGQLYFDSVREYAARHRVKPGITGWAQVNGWRGPTDTIEQLENRVMHDLYYINNWSFMLDVKILVKTAFVGFFGKNAF